MNPKVWGHHAWIFLHSITLNYPTNPTINDIKKHYNFFNNLMYILPCDKCKYHYKQNLMKYPLTNKILSSRENLINWLINIHNSVNYMNNKKQFTYDEMINKYNDIYNNIDNKFIHFNKIIIVLIIICIIIILFKDVFINKINGRS